MDAKFILGTYSEQELRSIVGDINITLLPWSGGRTLMEALQSAQI
jgi:hypothetical protein